MSELTRRHEHSANTMRIHRTYVAAAMEEKESHGACKRKDGIELGLGKLLVHLKDVSYSPTSSGSSECTAEMFGRAGMGGCSCLVLYVHSLAAC